MALKPAWPGAVYAEHQNQGIQWMLKQESFGYTVPNTNSVVRGGILGDEMGLGKTIQSLGLIVNSKARSTLIITPLAVRSQWEEAAKRCSVNLYTAESLEWKAHTKVLPSRPTIFLAHYDKLISDVSMFTELHFDRVLAEGLHRGVQVDALLVDREAASHEFIVEVVHGDGAEHLAAFARLHGEREAGQLEFLGEFLRAVEFERFALGATLLERFDLLAVRGGDRRGKATREEKIAGIACTHFDLVAFAAETFDGF
jgi:hypothetical protein